MKKSTVLSIGIIGGILVGVAYIASPTGAMNNPTSRGLPGGGLLGVNNARADDPPAPAGSSTTAPTATATSTSTTKPSPTPSTNPKPVPGAGQPSVKDVENNATVTAKCAVLPATIRHSMYIYGVEQAGGSPVLIKACGNPNFVTERRGTFNIEGTLVRLGLEGDRQTCGPIKPWDTGAQPVSQGEWLNAEGDTLQEVNFKRFEGGTGTLVNWHVVHMSACTGTVSPFLAPPPPPPPPAEKKPTCGTSCCGSGCGPSKPPAPASTIVIVWPSVTPTATPTATTTASPPAPKVDPNPYLGKT